ncbi:MAG: hypothetical protein JKY50_19380 [Oleispira sp.]|nr:hypothetical protein [Oleispira sp.]MBL4881118.1 hypothetical protein [Oleispira sp.]
MAKEKLINVKINTTLDYLSNAGLSLEDIKERIQYLTDCFGTKFPRMFPLNVNNNDIERISLIFNCLKRIEACDGFDRHIIQYDKNNIDDHLFSANVAIWFLDKGYSVTLEPLLESLEGGTPDLFIEQDDSATFVVECKNINISRFFEIESKQEIADIIYEKVCTCDQISLYMTEYTPPSEISEIFSNPELIKNIHMNGARYAQADIQVNEKLRVNIIRKPPITAREDDLPVANLGAILEDNSSGLRLPGYAFLKGGRSIGVFGPVPCYKRRWDDKRSKSKKQAISGYPMIVMVNGDNVLGNPDLHSEYFNNVWLTESNPQCSGVGLIYFTTKDGAPKLEYFKNNQATHLFDL